MEKNLCHLDNCAASRILTAAEINQSDAPYPAVWIKAQQARNWQDRQVWFKHRTSILIVAEEDALRQCFKAWPFHRAAGQRVNDLAAYFVQQVANRSNNLAQ
jgi:hypothetical protein